MSEKNQVEKIQTDLRNSVGDIVARDDVRYVIGYGAGTYATRVKPMVVHSPEAAGKLIWSPLCVNNLTVFLKHAEKLPVPRGQEADSRKIGVIVKGCEARALNQLMQEQWLKREDLVIIGIACEQCIEPSLVEDKLAQKGFDLNTKIELSWAGDKLVVKSNGSKAETFDMDADGLIQDKCTRCEVPTPEDADIIVGRKTDSYGKDVFADLKEMESMSQNDREEFWDRQFDKCLKCFACRNICPVCVCKTCVLDSLSPQWVERSSEFDKKKIYHLMRTYCMLGRCIDCGECERACPVDIPLTKLYRAGQKSVKETFDYEAGRNATEKPVFTRYDLDDKGGTIW